MSDGWQGRIFQRHTIADKGGNRVVRVTRVRRHFALQRGLVKVRQVDGELLSAMVFVEPRPLGHGARSSNFLTVLNEFWQSPRLATKAHVVEVFCFDGELFTALQKLISGKRQLMYEMAEELILPSLSQVGGDDAIDIDLLAATHFQLYVKCTSHSLSNGTKCGLSRWTGPDVIDDLFISIAACRSCSSDVIDCLSNFTDGLIYEDPDWSEGEWASRRMMWAFLVDDSRKVDQIMEVNPRRDVAAQKLRVSSALKAKKNGHHEVLYIRSSALGRSSPR